MTRPAPPADGPPPGDAESIATDGPPPTDTESTAADGSPVALYAALGPHDAVDLVADQAPDGGSVLDLGCGVGRLARPLADAGLAVTGVDNHAAMLDGLPASVTAVHADIDGLDLGRVFDVVVLASHLVNHPDLAAAFLATCRRHVAADGAVVIERFAPGLLADLDQRDGSYDGIHVRHELVEHDGERFRARAHYTVGDRTWVQAYEAVVLGDDAFEDRLATAGLELWEWLDDDTRWALALPAEGG